MAWSLTPPWKMFLNTTTGFAGSRERQTQAAAFAGAFLHELRFGVGGAAIPRGRDVQAGAVVFFPARGCGNATALVQPRREYGTVRIQCEGFKALALVVCRNRPQVGEIPAAVGRPRVQDLTVEGLVPEDRERHGDLAVLADDNLGTGIRPPIEVEVLPGQLNRRCNRVAAVGRTGDGYLASRHPGQPQCSVRSEGRRHLRCAAQGGLVARSVGSVLMGHLTECRRLPKRKGQRPQ